MLKSSENKENNNFGEASFTHTNNDRTIYTNPTALESSEIQEDTTMVVDMIVENEKNKLKKAVNEEDEDFGSYESRDKHIRVSY